MTFFELPDEIILQVLRYLDDEKARPFSYESDEEDTDSKRIEEGFGSSLLPLCLVSRRLNALAEPLLYKRLRFILKETSAFSIRGPTKPNGFDTLYNTLCQDSRRHDFVEHFELDWSLANFSNRLWQDLVLVLIRKGVSISLKCCVELYDDIDEAFLKALNLGKVHSLETDYIDIETLAEPGFFPVLQTLKLKRICSANWPAWDDDWHKEFSLPVNQHHKSTVEHLEVRFEGSPLLTVLPVMQWIAKLKSIYFDFGFDTQFWSVDTFAADDLQNMLNLHSNTLESVALTPFVLIEIPDFRNFSNLRELQISQATFDLTKDGAGNLSAPRLNELNIDCEEVQMDRECGPKTRKVAFRHVYGWLRDFVVEYRRVVPTGGLGSVKLIRVWYDGVEHDECLAELKTAFDDSNISLIVIEGEKKDINEEGAVW